MLTHTWMVDNYREINEKYFNGELSEEGDLILSSKKVHSRYGCYDVKEKSITLYTCHKETKTHMKETLAHEMIHKWLHQNDIDCVHGKEFKAKAKELTEAGLMVRTQVKYKSHVKDPGLECETNEEKLQNNAIMDYIHVNQRGFMYIAGEKFVASTYDIIRDICGDYDLTEDDIKALIIKVHDKMSSNDKEKNTQNNKMKKNEEKTWKDYIIWKKDKYDDDTLAAENVASNYLAYLEHNPAYKGRLKYNEYRCQIEFNYGTEAEPCWKPIEDVVYNKIHSDIDNDLRLSSRCKVEDAIALCADNHKFHEVMDYFNSLMWDHKPRVETFFIDWLKADDTPLNREMTRLWFIGAVKRMIQPGCKMDTILITIGEQGSGKSWLIEKLSNGFGYETNIRIDKEQEYGQKLDNTWFAVFDELASLNKKEASDIKKWFSITMDTFRSPYAHVPKVHKRHCIYYGTTNDDYFLRDYTARCERRYWTILCHQKKAESWEKFKNFTQEVIDQIWAEAVELYLQNPDIELDIKGEYYQMLEDVQQQFKTSNEDTIAETLENYLNKKYILNGDGQFADDQDCINQMKGKTRDINADEHYGNINIIPSRQVKLILKEVLHDVRKHKYFENETSGFSKRWIVNKYEAGSFGTMCYKRVNPILGDDNKIKCLDEVDEDPDYMQMF